jgi:hypothetical protein
MFKFYLLYLIIFFGIIESQAQINSTYERSNTLGNDHLEIAGSYSHYDFSSEGSGSVGAYNNYGGRFGVGLTDDVDIKIRYERFLSAQTGDEAADYLSIFPKFEIWNDEISVIIPLSSYFDESVFSSVARYSIAPEFIGTHPFSKKVDVTGNFKLDYFFPKNNLEDELLFGFKLGFGLSSDLEKWSLRPEAGLLIDSNDSGQLWSYGLALQFRFDY